MASAGRATHQDQCEFEEAELGNGNRNVFNDVQIVSAGKRVSQYQCGKEILLPSIIQPSLKGPNVPTTI